MVKVGQHVVFVDSFGRQHDALVTGTGDPEHFKKIGRESWTNLVIVTGDESRTDTYGRQIERFTSVSPKPETEAHGMYWMYKGEEPNPIVEVHS